MRKQHIVTSFLSMESDLIGMAKRLSTIQMIILTFVSAVGGIWGVLEASTYFGGEALKQFVGGYWPYLVYGLPAFITIGVVLNHLRKSRQQDNTTDPIRLTQFSVDEAKSNYRKFTYDSKKEIFPGKYKKNESALQKVEMQGGIYRYGRYFVTWEEKERYKEKLMLRTNHYFFRSLAEAGLSSIDVPIIIDQINKTSPPKGNHYDSNIIPYPLLVFTITNDTNSQLILARFVFRVHSVICVRSAGESHILEPLASYCIYISSIPGNYEHEMVPAIKIAAQDSASFTIQILPKSLRQNPTGRFLIASVAIQGIGVEICTPNFAMYFLE